MARRSIRKRRHLAGRTVTWKEFLRVYGPVIESRLVDFSEGAHGKALRRWREMLESGAAER